MTKDQSTVLFVEDELSLIQDFPLALRREGYRVLSTSDLSEAVSLIEQEKRIDILVSDIQMSLAGCDMIGVQEAEGGRLAGLVLAQIFRKKFDNSPIVFWSGSAEGRIRTRVLELDNAVLIPKRAGPRPVLEMISASLDGTRSGTRPRTFIVHGHDEETMRSVKQYLQDDLGFPEPTVLRDMPSYGQTIIEKLESYSHTIDLVFVLMTPDDEVTSSGAPNGEGFRSRQNVIFELGYFLGVLGRHTGRVILLYREPIELPSDIGGMVRIDISEGLQKADLAIRQEILEWLDHKQ